MSRPVALISGAGRAAGIGAGIAKALAGDGWDLALTYWPHYDERMPWGHQPSDIQLLEKELLLTGAQVLLVPADLECLDSTPQVFGAIGKTLGSVSALVLSHCESVASGILDTSIESFDRHFAVNVRASWLLIQAFAGQVPSAGGHIVALTSDHTIGDIPYGTSKGALDRLVLAAARELAHLRITSNVVNPGPIDTGWMNEDIRKTTAERQPTGRIGTPADVAQVISFLLSPAGAWVNGQLIKADGGFSA
jgi:3-oxoacyl-[acyl-carrier protein] reductase